MLPGRAHGLEQLLDVPFAPALVRANSLGLVYDFLIDSSASLSAELPAVKKKEAIRREGWNSMSKEVINLSNFSVSCRGFGDSTLSHFFI